MKHYTYIVTNLINGKQYVGDHSTDNLNDGYLGSGTIIINAVKKYDRKNFKLKILEQVETKQKAFELQEKYINEYNTLIPNGYNISPKGGIGCYDCFSNEIKLKISNTLKEGYKNGYINPAYDKPKSIKTREKISNTLKERYKNGYVNPRKGTHLSEEAKKKLRKPKSEETKMRMRKPKTESHKEKLRLANLGKHHSDETKKKMSISRIGKKMPDEVKEKISKANKGRKFTEEHKEKLRQAKLGKKRGPFKNG